MAAVVIVLPLRGGLSRDTFPRQGHGRFPGRDPGGTRSPTASTLDREQRVVVH
jgi:hypothetical protein